MPAPSLFLSVLASASLARADAILFINWGASSGQYDGENIYQVLVDMGHTVDYLDVPADGDVAAALGATAYDQVWLFDASSASSNRLDDSGDLSALVDFHLASPHLIMDSRSYGLPYYGASSSSYPYEGLWVENEAEALSRAGGGMWLGGDHEGWNDDIDAVMTALGYPTWSSSYSGAISTTVDTWLWECYNTVDPTALWVGTVADIADGTVTGTYDTVDLVAIASSSSANYIVTTITDDALDLDDDGWSVDDGDCDDADPDVNPDATETWYDGADQDCDGASDYDADADGYDADAYGGSDCDDADASVNPDAAETENGIDDDCDGSVDEGTAAYDDDGDGFSENDGDCDDADASVNPDAAETENGIDDDCDGQVDEGFGEDTGGAADTGGATDTGDELAGEGEKDDYGCGCASAGDPLGGSWLLAPLALLGLARRRES